MEWLLDIVFPKFCIDCGRFGSYICSNCEQTINFYSPQTCPYCEQSSLYGLTHPRCVKAWGLDGMFVLAHYDGLIKDIIHRVKYEGQHAISLDLARVLLNRYEGVFRFDYLVPVPLARKRLDERGFNQARVLADNLYNVLRIMYNGEKKDGINVIELLVRSRETKPQFDLKYEDRKKNVSGAFSLNYELTTTNLSGYSFCLVDDVATTGATIFECAKILKKSGADKVWAICVARGG